MPSSFAERLRSIAKIATLNNLGTDLGDILQRITFAVCQSALWSTSAIMALDQDSGFSVLVVRHDPEFGKSSRRRERGLLKTSPVPIRKKKGASRRRVSAGRKPPR